MKGEPCLCGATDCPRCFPGCNDPVECKMGKETFPAHEMGSSELCENCEGEIAAMRDNLTSDLESLH